MPIAGYLVHIVLKIFGKNPIIKRNDAFLAGLLGPGIWYLVDDIFNVVIWHSLLHINLICEIYGNI